MKINRIVFAALLAIGGLVSAANVPAQSVDECKDRIDLIQIDLNGVDIGGNNAERTRASLTSKLQGAKEKLDQGKFADALVKLQDFRAAVIVMRDSAKPKLSLADADLLLDGNGDSAIDEGINGAILCVSLLP